MLSLAFDAFGGSFFCDVNDFKESCLDSLHPMSLHFKSSIDKKGDSYFAKKSDINFTRISFWSHSACFPTDH